MRDILRVGTVDSSGRRLATPLRKGGDMYGGADFSDPFGRGNHRSREIHKKITAHPSQR
nr:MAG TPA: hypothetical protein [Caudoviricetes sp.]